MTRRFTKLGPADAGRRMRLAEFAAAEGQAGYVYELGRGAVVVVDVPGRKHQDQVAVLRLQLSGYQIAHPTQVHAIASGNECELLLAGPESARHPDLAVYKSPPLDEREPWATRVPELVVEVVSPGSEQRDYVEKRDEYLQFGVTEYWIVDASRRKTLVLHRSGGCWAEHPIGEGETYHSQVLPGFRFDFANVLAAADAVQSSD
jgi:Uma2 family endonuclease